MPSDRRTDFTQAYLKIIIMTGIAFYYYLRDTGVI